MMKLWKKRIKLVNSIKLVFKKLQCLMTQNILKPIKRLADCLFSRREKTS